MSNTISLDLDPANLSPADRAAVHRLALREIAQIEAQQEASARRLAAMDEDEANARTEAEHRAAVEAAQRTTEFASRAAVEERRRVDVAAKRALDADASEAERAAQASLALDAFRRAGEFGEIARRAKTRLEVSEPPIYSPHSPNSYFADVMAATLADHPNHRDAVDRLSQYRAGLSRDLDRAGMRARRAWRERSRLESGFQSQSDANYRAMSSSGSSGGAMVTPDYLTDQYALWRSYVPAVADACNNTVALPSYGLTVSVPGVTSGAPVTKMASENTDPGSSNFSAAYITQPVNTYYGYTEISQALYDRSGPTKFDEVVHAQLQASLDADVDQAVIAAMIAGATTNLTRATFTDMSSLWSDVNKAAASLDTTAGTLLPATHAFLPPTSFRWFASQVDSEKRPIWTPDGSSEPDPNSGFTGYRIASTAVYTDGSIPASGSDAQFIVANPGSTLLLRGEPYLSVVPQTDASTLSVLVRLYQYAAVIVRYPSAAATISGAAYPTAVTWA